MRYCRYETRHLAGCARLVRDTWDLTEGFREVKRPSSLYEAYVRSCLDYSEHRELILDESGEVKGILFGSTEKRSLGERARLFFRLTGTLRQTAFRLVRGDFGRPGAAVCAIRNHLRLDAAGEEDSDLFDGEVNLFIVAEELRGRGMGFALMNRYLDFCRARGLKRLFLWTDTDCSYGFYERFGFSLLKRFSAGTKEKGGGRGMVFRYDLS